jgi:DeoR family glycerol-3-phosphate regulon repressor
MDHDERREEIKKVVRAQGYMSIEGLARHFRVTPQTIRRDINALSELGEVRRHHGGASLPSSVENLAYATRQALAHHEKQLIGKLAAQHIPDRASLFINLGTTTEEVARALVKHRELRVITNNLNVVPILSENESCEILVAGGLVRRRDRGVIGEAALDFIKQFKVDYAIIGISGIDADGTLLDFDYREVQVSKTIIANAREVFLVADHTKFGRSAMVRLGHAGELDALFTDRPLDSPYAEAFAEAEVAVHVATEAAQAAATARAGAA